MAAAWLASSVYRPTRRMLIVALAHNSITWVGKRNEELCVQIFSGGAGGGLIQASERSKKD